MPKTPDPACPICGGSGLITDPAITRLSGPNRKPGDPAYCRCTITEEQASRMVSALLAGAPAPDPESMQALLRDLSRARPLLLYGEAWIEQIERVLSGERYEPVFPREED